VRSKLPSYFGVLPRANVEIKRVPMETEVAASGGYYDNPSLDGKRAGIYWINLRDTAERPTWTLPALTYHESIPGHHVQLSIQQEANLPLLRKVSFYGAYGEGWALYAEQLAAEMGEYDDDLAGHIGHLQSSMFRAVRLVVDTGMHSMGWTREQAIQFFKDNTGKTDQDITVEVDRYIVWPGQALAYKLGQLKIRELRTAAEKKLGANFNVRRFHDAVLEQGSVPLDVLEGHMQQWLEAQAGH
jgi:uncharacterized protein (DUF885 family)